MSGIGHRKTVQPEGRIQQRVFSLRLLADRQSASEMRPIAVSLIPEASRKTLVVEADRSEIAGQVPAIKASERPVRPAEFPRPVPLDCKQQLRILQPAAGQHKGLCPDVEGSVSASDMQSGSPMPLAVEPDSGDGAAGIDQDIAIFPKAIAVKSSEVGFSAPAFEHGRYNLALRKIVKRVGRAGPTSQKGQRLVIVAGDFGVRDLPAGNGTWLRASKSVSSSVTQRPPQRRDVPPIPCAVVRTGSA
jgi:hypothetical protein